MEPSVTFRASHFSRPRRYTVGEVLVFFCSLPAFHARSFRKPGMSMRSISSMRQPLSSSELYVE